jgi:hypothetical protein
MLMPVEVECSRGWLWLDLATDATDQLQACAQFVAEGKLSKHASWCGFEHRLSRELRERDWVVVSHNTLNYDQ